MEKLLLGGGGYNSLINRKLHSIILFCLIISQTLAQPGNMPTKPVEGAQGQANFQFWGISGNGNITGNNYFDTSNSHDVIIKTNSFERFRITSNGDIIINPFT
ncbi:MAG: hypothetical protein HY738_18485 [Bacteroidia bacterium]|nr:hypothetical protein [Bacteroidia bacterium]